MIKALACTCGDCTHWEIIILDSAPDVTLKCVTCQTEVSARLYVSLAGNLAIIEREDA